MTIEVLISIMLTGLISGNVVVASGLGVDLAGSNINTIKNSLILSLVVFLVALGAGIVTFVVNLILVNSGLEALITFVVFLVVATMVQIAEFVLEKAFPVMHTKLSGFIVTLIPAVSIILLGLFACKITFLEMILDILFICFGISVVMAVIGGVRNNKLTYSSYDILKGNLMTIAILFVLALLWTVI